jgi:hypothetical protein
VSRRVWGCRPGDPEVTRSGRLIRAEECPDRERFLTLWSQVAVAIDAGGGAFASPPGSLGEAANGGIGQAGLRLPVPNEPGGHSSPSGQEHLPVCAP